MSCNSSEETRRAAASESSDTQTRRAAFTVLVGGASAAAQGSSSDEANPPTQADQLRPWILAPRTPLERLKRAVAAVLKAKVNDEGLDALATTAMAMACIAVRGEVTRPFLVKPADPEPPAAAEIAELLAAAGPAEPPAELIEEAMQGFHREDVAQFSSELESARAIWRARPDLVLADTFPEPYGTAFTDYYGFPPSDDHVEIVDGTITEEFRREHLKVASEVASHWAAKRSMEAAVGA